MQLFPQNFILVQQLDHADSQRLVLSVQAVDHTCVFFELWSVQNIPLWCLSAAFVNILHLPARIHKLIILIKKQFICT